MGAVFRPKDVGGFTRVIENAVKDFSPDTKDSVIKLFKSWQGGASLQELNEIIGTDRAKDLLKKINAYNEDDLTEEERDRMNEIFRESLTFD